MNKMKKLLSSLLALSMVLSYVPMPAVAEEVCTHHAHDDKCGYVQAVEGKSCTHQCTESCPKKDVTVCVHDHASLGCAHTPAVEGVACDHVHGEACGYVPAQAAVPCTCGAVAAHTAQCASLVTEGAECDCGMPTLHAEGCEPKAAVAEQCSHVHGECAYEEAVKESWSCGHACSKDSGCVQSVCAHAHDASCGYVQAVKGSDCTFVCTECKAEEKTCTCESTDPGEHAPFCDLYVRTYEECKCVLDCAVEGLNDYCETCYFEGVEACGASGEEEAVPFVQTGYTGECSWTFDEANGLLTIYGPGSMGSNAFSDIASSIQSVIIKEGVTTIVTNAFRGCSNLTSVTIPGSVKTIDRSAFSVCSSLTTINYYGLTEPTDSPAIFGKNPPSTINVPENYEDETFAGKNVDKSLPPVNTSTTYTITATAAPVAGGTVTGAADYAEGTTVTLTATANSGYKFVNWTENGAVVGTEATYSFQASADRNLTAVFEAHVHNWTYTASGATITAACTAENCPNTDGGSVTISASNATYDGTAKAATATPENWLADNVSIQYQKQSGETWDAATSTAPTDAGTYRASITLDTATVSAEYTITPLEIKDEHVVLTPSSAVYDGTVKGTDVMVVVDGKNIDSLNYEVTGLDALGSAIGEYPITITGKGNYSGTVTKNFEITAKQLSEASVTLTADLTYHGEAQEPAITVKDGNTELSRTSDYTVSYEKVNENSSATPIQGAPVDAGHYNAIITGKGSYGGEIRKSFKIKPNTSIDVAPTELDDEVYTGEEIKPAVQVTGVKPTALEKDKDYAIVYENNTNAGEAKITITGIGNYAGAKKELTFTITAKGLTEANVTIGETILGYEEGKTIVPEITVKDGSKTLTAGTDYVVTYLDKDGQKVDVPSAVGIYTVQVIGIADLSEDGSGNYSGTVSKTFVITDDVTAPEITGVTNGKTYYTTQKVTARDENLVSVTKNGTAITPVVATGTEVTLEGNQTATYTVAAVDIAENESAITITMKPISFLDDTIENLTTENVKLSDKDAIEDVLNAVKSILESECGNATQTEKNALDAIISKCDDLLKVITDVENAISKIQALPNPAETAPDNETAVKAYDAAKKAYDALSEHGKELVGAENKAKLDAMLKALTAYDVIKGHKSSYTRGSGKTFSLTANGYFGKFTGLKIDGRILDSKYYTAKSGSTIVTLKNSYLDSLSDGKHTVEFLYTDGSTGGDHYFRISTNNGSPFTGDNNHIMMFSGIMMTSLLCMAMMIMFIPRKKGKYQR